MVKLNPFLALSFLQSQSSCITRHFASGRKSITIQSSEKKAINSIHQTPQKENNFRRLKKSERNFPSNKQLYSPNLCISANDPKGSIPGMEEQSSVDQASKLGQHFVLPLYKMEFNYCSHSADSRGMMYN
jgi:hypothetical protein